MRREDQSRGQRTRQREGEAQCSYSLGKCEDAPPSCCVHLIPINTRDRPLGVADMPVRGPRPCPSGRAGRAGRAQCTQGWWEGPPTDQLSSIPPQALSQCSDAAGKRMGCLLNCLAETRGLSCGGPQLGMLAHRQQYPGCLTWFNSGSSQTEQPQCPETCPPTTKNYRAQSPGEGGGLRTSERHQ